MTVTTQRPPALLKPTAAWVPILGLAVATVGGTFGGAGSLVNLAFPAGALVVSLFLYSRYPIIYNGFCWWIWLLSPLVRRLADMGSGFTDPSPVLLAPYLVTLAILPELLLQIPRAKAKGILPFVLPLAAVAYGVLIGLQNRAPNVVAVEALRWLSPLLLGYYTFKHWRRYPEIQRNVQTIFIWGVLLLGAYAIYQYLTLPEWDRFWLVNAEINSIGDPSPRSFRPWSTLNSGEPFAAFMTAGLLLLLNATVAPPLLLAASGCGYLGFLLAMVRSAWLGWGAGLMILWTALRPHLQIRLFGVLLVLSFLVVPLVLAGPYADTITERLTSLSDLSGDRSAQVRQETYDLMLGQALRSFIGQGIGGDKLDSSILSFLFDLGWLGTLLYLSGLLAACFFLFSPTGRGSGFIAVLKAVTASILVRAPVNTVAIEVSGTILWVFLALGMAASRYHRYQTTSPDLSLSSYSSHSRTL